MLPSGFVKLLTWKGKISCLSVIQFVIAILEVAMVRVINISIINLFHKLLKLHSASVKQTKSQVGEKHFMSILFPNYEIG